MSVGSSSTNYKVLHDDSHQGGSGHATSGRTTADSDNLPNNNTSLTPYGSHSKTFNIEIGGGGGGHNSKGTTSSNSAAEYPYRSDTLVHFLGLIFVIRQFIRFIATLIPLINYTADLLTIILYFTVATNRNLIENNNNNYTNNESFNINYNRFVSSNFDIIVLILFIFSTRCYFICFSATADHSTLFFIDYDVVRNMYRLIPLCGAPIGSCVNDEYREDFSMGTICSWFCYELISLIGAAFVPLCILYVIIRNCKLLFKQIFITLFHLRSDRSNRNRSESAAVNNYFIRKQARQYEKFVKEKKHKYYQQITLLKFSEGLFEAIPQIILQFYVKTQYPFVYDNNNENEHKNMYQILFWISIISSALTICRCMFEVFFHWDRLMTLFD